jgi:hypothetical protein
MMRSGPEALMVRAKTEVRVDLALYAQLEFARRDARDVEGRIREELEELSERASSTVRLGRWMRRALRGRDERGPKIPAGWQELRGINAIPGAVGGPRAPPSLAAIPAAGSGYRAQGRSPPLSTAPAYLR